MAEILRKRDCSWTGFPHRTSTLATVMMLASVAWSANLPEAELEAANYRQIVEGDLKSAIDEYKRILAEPGRSREVSAQALFQMGECQEKLGERREAYATYRRILREYGDQAEVVAQARAQLAGWVSLVPGPRNLKFEQGVPGKAPPGWIVVSLPKDADSMAQLRRTGCRSGAGCAAIRVPPNALSPVASLMQSFSAALYRGKTVRVEAWLKVEASSPGDQAQMLLSVDRSNRQSGFFDNMNDRPIRSADWTRCEIVGPVDPDAIFINFGVLSIGRGTVWVDDVSFELVR